MVKYYTEKSYGKYIDKKKIIFVQRTLVKNDKMEGNFLFSPRKETIIKTLYCETHGFVLQQNKQNQI